MGSYGTGHYSAAMRFFLPVAVQDFFRGGGLVPGASVSCLSFLGHLGLSWILRYRR